MATVNDVDPAADADLQAHIRAQEQARLQAQVREEVRAATWAEMRAKFWAAVVGLAVVSMVAGGLIGFYGFRSASMEPLPALTPPAHWSSSASGRSEADAGSAALMLTVTPWPIHVYVSGAVVSPRIVELSAGSLVTDALAAAGGPTSDADLDGLNLAARLADNEHIYVPRRTARVGGSGSRTESDTSPVATVFPSLIDVNSASAEELERLPGIGPTRAMAIVAYREAHGPFEQAEDLLAVPGIGPVTYERIVSLITVTP